MGEKNVVVTIGMQGPSGPPGLQGERGITGPPGPAGSTMYSGDVVPTASMGNIGDFYLLTTNGDIYKKQSSTLWLITTNVKGPQGIGVPAGGTLGQVLMKNSATNYDTEWVTPETGSDFYEVIANIPRFYARDEDFWQIESNTGRTKLLTPNILNINIGGVGYRLPEQQTLDMAIAATWDTITPTDYTTATNRAGKDFYIYACQPASGQIPKIILSANTTAPNGYTHDNSIKIGGFHCLCLDVGVVAEHSLSGYLAGDIIPTAIWDLKHRPITDPEGMTYDPYADMWVDIYLNSIANDMLVSKYLGIIADGTSTEAFHWYKAADWLTVVKKRLPFQHEFVSAAMGSNQGTNIFGSTDPNTTGGHKDTANRRMVSNIGCEDMCGAMWQWGLETGAGTGGSTYANAYDANDYGVGGQAAYSPSRAIFGGAWTSGVACGSRSSYWTNQPLTLQTSFGIRGWSPTLRKV